MMERQEESLSATNPKVTIVVPVYNAEAYLARCISSILCQSHKNLEVLLINDGSTDRSASICNEAHALDARVRVIHIQNGGVSKARNLGIAQATGQFVQFVDADDHLEPEMTEALLSAAGAGDGWMIVGGFQWEDSRTGERRVVAHTQSHLSLDKMSFLCIYADLYSLGLVQRVWNSLYRVDRLRAHRIAFDADLSYGEDVKFNSEVIKAGDSFSVATAAHYIYSEPVDRQGDRLSNRPGVDTYHQRRARHEERVSIFGTGEEFGKQIDFLERHYAKHLMISLPIRLAVNLRSGDFPEFRRQIRVVRSDDILLRHIDERLEGPLWQLVIAWMFKSEMDLALFASVRFGSVISPWKQRVRAIVLWVADVPMGARTSSRKSFARKSWEEQRWTPPSA